MKNLKKVLAVVLALTLLAVAYLPATVSAETFKYSNEATFLNQMGLYAGISTSSFVPDLGSTVTKEQGVALLLRALGYKAYALAMTEDQITNMLKVFTDADQVSAWARPYMAAGISLGLVNGNPDFTLGAKALMDSKMMAKLILANTDYTIDPTVYQSGPYVLREHGAFTYAEAEYFMGKAPIIRDDLVGMMFLSLKLKYNGTNTTVIGKLVNAGLVNEAVALRSGAYTNDIVALATAKVAEFEAAPVSTTELQTAALAIKAAAEALINKFATTPTATTPSMVAIKTALTNRIAARLAILTSGTFDIVTTSRSTLVINFTKAVAPATVAKGLKLQLNNAAATTLEAPAVWALSNGDKTLTLTYAAVQPIGTLVTVTSTTDLKSADTSAVTVATKSANITDTVAPAIGNTVTFGLTKNVMTLTVSETIANTPKFVLDDVVVTPVMTQEAGKLILTMPTNVTKVAHVLKISGYADVNGMVGPEKVITFTPDYEEVAPALTSVAYVNTRVITFTFSEAIKAAPASAFTVGGIAAQSTAISGSTVTVTLASALGLSSLNGVSAVVAADLVSDLTGNLAATATMTVTSSYSDVTGATLTYTYDNATQTLKVTANEDVTIAAGTYTISAGGSVYNTGTIASAIYLAQGQSFNVDFSWLGLGGVDVVFAFATTVKDLSLSQNNSSPLTYSFKVPVPPAV